MNYISFYFLVALLTATSATHAKTIGEIFPWLGSNNTSIGNTFQSFSSQHPDAVAIFENENTVDPNANKILVEQTPDDSVSAYEFQGNKLITFAWSKILLKNQLAATTDLRNKLILSYGQPALDTVTRMDSVGSVAQIAREIYTFTDTPELKIFLSSTEDGLELQVSVAADNAAKTAKKPSNSNATGAASNYRNKDFLLEARSK